MRRPLRPRCGPAFCPSRSKKNRSASSAGVTGGNCASPEETLPARAPSQNLCPGGRFPSGERTAPLPSFRRNGQPPALPFTVPASPTLYGGRTAPRRGCRRHTGESQRPRRRTILRNLPRDDSGNGGSLREDRRNAPAPAVRKGFLRGACRAAGTIRPLFRFCADFPFAARRRPRRRGRRTQPGGQAGAPERSCPRRSEKRRSPEYPTELFLPA